MKAVNNFSLPLGIRYVSRPTVPFSLPPGLGHVSRPTVQIVIATRPGTCFTCNCPFLIATRPRACFTCNCPFLIATRPVGYIDGIKEHTRTRPVVPDPKLSSTETLSSLRPNPKRASPPKNLTFDMVSLTFSQELGADVLLLDVPESVPETCPKASGHAVTGLT